jgi:hypothetical protein
MLYDFCNFLYYECWGKILFPNEVYSYSIDDDVPLCEVSAFRRSRSWSELPLRRLPREIMKDQEEEVVWTQPKFELGAPGDSDSWDSWDDFVEVENI